MQVKNKYLLLLLCAFLLWACGGNNDKRPEHLLTPEQMTALLIDIQLADATINLSQYGQVNFPNDKEKLFSVVYTKHKTTKKIVEESFAYYTERPEIFEKMYDEVLIELSKKQAELSK